MLLFKCYCFVPCVCLLALIKHKKMHNLIHLPYSNTNLERYNDIIPDKPSVLLLVMQSLIGTWSLPRATPIEYADVGVCVCEWYMYVDIQLQWGIPCNVKRLCAHMVSLCGLCCLCSYRRKNVCLNNVLTPLWVSTSYWRCMGLLPDTQNCGLRMRRERFPCHWLQRKPLVSDPGMHHSTCRDACRDR